MHSEPVFASLGRWDMDTAHTKHTIGIEQLSAGCVCLSQSLHLSNSKLSVPLFLVTVQQMSKSGTTGCHSIFLYLGYGSACYKINSASSVSHL